MKKIVYKNEKGGMSLVTPSDKHFNNLEFVASKSVPNNYEYFIIDEKDLPKELEFFDAFCIQKNKEEVSVIVNTSKAKDIWLERFRRARTPLLEKLDLEYMRADEQGNLELKKEIASKKQALRDVTKTELPDTLEGIKATWPEILGSLK